MVNETKLWTERYESPKYGLEPKAALKYFQEYLKLDFPRTITELCRTINSKRSQNNVKTQIRESSLYTYSCKFDWEMREEAHDNYYSNIREKQKKLDTEKWESRELKKAMQRVNMCNGTFDELHGNKEIAVNKRVYAESENQDAYNAALDAVYKIRFGGTPPNKNINQSSVEANVNATTENTHGIDETVYKELLDVIKPRYNRND